MCHPIRQADHLRRLDQLDVFHPLFAHLLSDGLARWYVTCASPLPWCTAATLEARCCCCCCLCLLGEGNRNVDWSFGWVSSSCWGSTLSGRAACLFEETAKRQLRICQPGAVIEADSNQIYSQHSGVGKAASASILIGTYRSLSLGGRGVEGTKSTASPCLQNRVHSWKGAVSMVAHRAAWFASI